MIPSASHFLEHKYLLTVRHLMNTLTRAILLRIDNSMWNEVARVCTKHYLNVFDIVLFPKKTPNYHTFITKRHLSDLAKYVKILFESWFLVDTRKEFLRIMETHI